MYFSEYAVYTETDPKYEHVYCVFFARPGEMGRHGRIYIASKGETGAEWTKLDLDDEGDCGRMNSIFPSGDVLRCLLNPSHERAPEGWKLVRVHWSGVMLVRGSIYPIFCRYLDRKYNMVTSRGKKFELYQHWPWAVSYAIHKYFVAKEREHQERKN